MMDLWVALMVVLSVAWLAALAAALVWLVGRSGGGDG